MPKQYYHSGIYGDMPPLSEGAMAALTVRENPFLAEIMKRRDERAWEQAQAIDAARNAPTFPTVPGSSPQAAFQNQMKDALINSWKSGNPAAQKWAAQGFDPFIKAVMGNTEQTQEQKNAFGAAPNDLMAAEELIRRQIDPSFALNVASNNRIKETGYEYGQKRGFENLQLGNKKDFAGFEQGLKGFGTAPLSDNSTPVDPAASNLTGKALEIYNKKLAESQAQAVIDLPKVIDSGSQMLSLINKIKTHPGKSTVVGLKGATALPMVFGQGPIVGTDAADFTTHYKQIQGKAFLEAFNTLKGGGQITEKEGEKATQAMISLSTAQSEKDFDSSLSELESVVKTGLSRAQSAAKGGFQPGSGATGSWGESETPTIDDEKERAYQEYLKQNGQ